MAEDIVMPRLSDSMEEGTVLKWMKSVGDEVAVGDELAEIETDKANMVYEADTAGTLIEIVAGEGDTLPIGEVIARVGEEGEEPKDEPPKDEADSPAIPAPRAGETASHDNGHTSRIPPAIQRDEVPAQRDGRSRFRLGVRTKSS